VLLTIFPRDLVEHDKMAYQRVAVNQTSHSV